MRTVSKLIGLMSGTSLDGLDIAFCSFFKNVDTWVYTINHTETIAYPEDLSDALKDAISFPEKHIKGLDKKLGYFFAEMLSDFINKYDISPDIISSHGHTIFHQPGKAYTLQIGNGEIIARETGITTINDFRTYDIKLGGQGAPLVPIGDELLFPEFVACINLGGFSNISFSKDKNRIAFDICPCNLILNKAASESSLGYDKDGEMARSGNVNVEILRELNALEYYHLPHPKSLGLEWLKMHFFPILEKYNITETDLLATYSEHISSLIAGEINKLPEGKALITGGGAYNTFLIESIMSKTDQEIVIPDNQLIEFKEALIFAFLGLLRFRNEINILSSVTGSSKDHIAGTIHKKT